MEYKEAKPSYKEPAGESAGEITEKKSRFIASLRPVYTEQEATAFIEEIKKKYWDASHNCSAFVIGIKGELTRCSDDGEPSQTAGKPMLDVLLKEEIRNVCVVVTRYFGGTLLGTGGLVRAYQQAVKEVLYQAEIITLQYGIRLKITTDYNGIGKIQYILGLKEYMVEESSYTDMVSLKIMVPFSEADCLKKDLTEATSGQAKIEEIDRIYYSDRKK